MARQEVRQSRRRAVRRREGDYLLGQVFYSLNEDCQWHRQWGECLVRMAIEDNFRNRDTIQGWVHQWYPLASHAVNAFALLFADTLERSEAPPLQHTGEAIDCFYRGYLRSMNLQPSSWNICTGRNPLFE
jgi:hypothetical protein